jgi:hypothetical protein
MRPDDRWIKMTGRYRAYLLRLWQDVPGQPWRALLQDANTHERHGFQDLDQLLTFLRSVTDPAEAGHEGDR